jgi:integrase
VAHATTRKPQPALPADTYTGPTIAEMGESWARSLRARNARPETMRTYLTAVEQFDAFLAERGMPTEVAKVTREHVETFIEHLLATRSASTAKTRFGGLKTFFRYVTEDEGPMERMRAPVVEDVPAPMPDPDELRRLLASVSGRSFDDRRDRAMILLAADTGLRRGELVGLTVEDVDATSQTVTVRPLTSKSRRTRVVAFGPNTANALARYERMRRQHPKAATAGNAYWIGKLGPLTGAGVLQILHRRCEAAGVERMHPHQLRHFFAHAMKAAGMSDDDLKRLGGWRSSEMLARYGAAHAEQRALAAYRAMPSPADRL